MLVAFFIQRVQIGRKLPVCHCLGFQIVHTRHRKAQHRGRAAQAPFLAKIQDAANLPQRVLDCLGSIIFFAHGPMQRVNVRRGKFIRQFVAKGGGDMLPVAELVAFERCFPGLGLLIQHPKTI